MKIRNSTDFPDHMLRRMVSWCCHQIGLPVRTVQVAQFRNRRTAAWSGHAWENGDICVSIGPNEVFPQTDGRPGAPQVINDRTEALIVVTAHELGHLLQYSDWDRYQKLKQTRRCEKDARLVETRTLTAFRENRDDLLSEWSVPPSKRPTKPKPSRQATNAAKAEQKLAEWTRKLKLAQTKVRKYRQQVRRYERIGVIAAHN